MNTWENTPKDISELQGFTYIICDSTGKYYIGKKNFWFKKVAKPLKGKKCKRHSLVESDWKDYWGSSPKFLDYVKKKGKKNFRRIMIHHCKNKFEMAYGEAEIQFDWGVLFDNNSFNEVINLRLRKAK